MVKMNEFIEFKYHKSIWSKLRIYPTQCENENNAFFKAFSSYFILLVLITFNISSGTFVYENASQFTVALRACLFITGISQAIGMFYNYGLKLNEIQAVHIELQEIIDKMDDKGNENCYKSASFVGIT